LADKLVIGKVCRVRVLPSTAECHADDRIAGKSALVIEASANGDLREWWKCLIEEKFIWCHEDELEPLTDET